MKEFQKFMEKWNQNEFILVQSNVEIHAVSSIVCIPIIFSMTLVHALKMQFGILVLNYI